MTEHKKIRRHSKSQHLDGELKRVQDLLLVDGRCTLQEIIDRLEGLAREKGIDLTTLPSRSGLGRYAKNFLARLEVVNRAREQAQALVDSAAEGGHQFALEQAATEMILTDIMTYLVRRDDGDDVVIPALRQLATAMRQLQGASATRERVKADLKKELGRQVTGKLDELASQSREEGARLDPETLRRVREEIYGIVEPE